MDIMNNPLFLWELRTFLSRTASPAIEQRIQRVAECIFQTNCPLRIQWDLPRCNINEYGDWKPHSYQVATQERHGPSGERPNWFRYGHAYALVIRIELPNNVLLRDDRVALMKDVLIYGAGDLAGLVDIPLRRDPVYWMYHVQVITRIRDPSLSIPQGDSLWYQLGVMFLSLPRTLYRRDSAGYAIYDPSSTRYKSYMWEDEPQLRSSAFQQWAQAVKEIEREEIQHNADIRALEWRRQSGQIQGRPGRR
ncbi:hypothetical protein GGR53DRAFT_471121 [Hypoxylon sp. FL1150]|nr:hypothetical protein GGR53DRAFT_471121 [Hypoxylon sp. FL1150]